MEALSGEMQNDLIELWKIQSDVQAQVRFKGSDWIETKLRELLEAVRKFVSKYSPESYTVGVGVPLGASVSFTWTTSTTQRQQTQIR